MEKILYIVRGVPGSGKTTFANSLGRAVCTADDFYMKKGEYIWFADKIATAHSWCRRKCRRFMKVGVSPVIVANTNTTEKEFEPYVELAKTYGYRVFCIIVENRHGNASVHGVPEETLVKMRQRFQISL